MKEKGITLLALVITIIILLILAGITITSLTQTGLFEKAQEAKRKTEEKKEKENITLNEYEQWISKYESNKSGGQFINVDISNTNPEGAKPSGNTNPEGDKNSEETTVVEGNANKGIIIKDKNENEWVWIEVPKTEVFSGLTINTEEALTEQDYTAIKNKLKEYTKDYQEGSAGQGRYWEDEWYNECGIEAANGKTGTEIYKEMYNKMLKSVYTYGGFWISRYEIGDETATNNDYEVRTENSGTTGKAVSKANQVPYNYVKPIDAQSLASKMTPDSSKTSSLLFGIQWDLVCKFLETKGKLNIAEIKSGDGIGSTNWGNYSNKKLTLNRGRYNIKPDDSSVKWIPYTTDTENYVKSQQTSENENYYQLLTTGASEETKKMNIYDLAGNLFERTLAHATSDSHYECACMGGAFYGNGKDSPAAFRDYDGPEHRGYNIGFRTTLY